MKNLKKSGALLAAGALGLGYLILLRRPQQQQQPPPAAGGTGGPSGGSTSTTGGNSQAPPTTTTGSGSVSPVGGTTTPPATTTGQPGADVFGMAKVYGDLQPPGQYWDCKKVTATVHTSGDAQDTVDPWVDFWNGEGSYSMGQGKLTSNSDIGRIYVKNPNNTSQWPEDLEITGVFTWNSNRSLPSGESAYTQIFCRTNHGVGYNEDNILCPDRGYGLTLDHSDGSAAFEKETAHHKDNGYAGTDSTGRVFSKGQPLYFKYIVRNIEQNTKTQLQFWTSQDQGQTWQKKLEFIDTGSNWGKGYDSCSTGVNPALRLTAATVTPNNQGFPNFPSVYLRNEYSSVTWEKLSIRPIAPESSAAQPVTVIAAGSTSTGTATQPPPTTTTGSGATSTVTPGPVYSPALSWSLTNEAVYFGGQIEGYNWYINLIATGFKPSSQITFYIDEHSYSKFAGYGALYPPVVNMQADSTGKAVFTQKVYFGISQPDASYFQVGGYVRATDGTNSAGPVQFHYLYR